MSRTPQPPTVGVKSTGTSARARRSRVAWIVGTAFALVGLSAYVAFRLLGPPCWGGEDFCVSDSAASGTSDRIWLRGPGLAYHGFSARLVRRRATPRNAADVGNVAKAAADPRVSICIDGAGDREVQRFLAAGHYMFTARQDPTNWNVHLRFGANGPRARQTNTSVGEGFLPLTTEGSSLCFASARLARDATQSVLTLLVSKVDVSSVSLGGVEQQGLPISGG